jgi:hypothetical protein
MSHTHTLQQVGGHSHTLGNHTHSIVSTPGSHSHSFSDPESEFEVGDYVAFAACPDTLFKIEGGAEPFWILDYVAGPPLTENYHKTLFGEKPPAMPSVVETVLQPVNEMMVIAIMASEE